MKIFVFVFNCSINVNADYELNDKFVQFELSILGEMWLTLIFFIIFWMNSNNLIPIHNFLLDYWLFRSPTAKVWRMKIFQSHSHKSDIRIVGGTMAHEACLWVQEKENEEPRRLRLYKSWKSLNVCNLYFGYLPD